MTLDTCGKAGVSEAQAGQRETIAAMLGRAFQDDPVTAWIEPDPEKRAASLPASFAAIFDGDAAGMRLVSAGQEAATLWHLPGLPPRLTLWQKIAGFWHIARMPRDKARRVMALVRALDEHRLSAGHLYLHVAGCDPRAQGKGFGKAAVRAGLGRYPGRPAFLETANEANLPFYAGLGFAVSGEWTVPGGPRFWTMERPANPLP